MAGEAHRSDMSSAELQPIVTRLSSLEKDNDLSIHGKCARGISNGCRPNQFSVGTLTHEDLQDDGHEMRLSFCRGEGYPQNFKVRYHR